MQYRLWILWLKTADVQFLTWEKKLGGRLVTIVVQGTVSAATAAVDAALEQADGNIVASYVIANPHEETMRIITDSAKRQKFI